MSSEDVATQRKKVFETVHGLGIEVIDVYSAAKLSGKADRFFYQRGSHFAVSGSELVAKEVLKKIGHK